MAWRQSISAVCGLSCRADQISVALDFQEFALPHYRNVFPLEPQYRDAEGRIQPVSAPRYGKWNGVPLDYATYRRLVDEGLRVPRKGHGAMHAARVTLYVGLLAQLHRNGAKDLSERTYELQMAAAFHDVSRQDEGKDWWDAESAQVFSEWLKESGYSSEQVENWRATLLAKNDEEAADPQARLLHDADALEIRRFTYYKSRFEPSRLWLYRAGNTLSTESKNQFLAETDLFTSATEEHDSKVNLDGSANYYLGTVQELVKLHQRDRSMPLLFELVRELFEA
jgi:hypothetical protein